MSREIKRLLYVDKQSSFLEDIGKLLLRLLFGIPLALNHGWPSIRGVLSGHSDFPDPLGISPEISMAMAGFAEFICALFVIGGLFTRISVFPILINFSVAVFIFHGNDPFGRMELAYLYLSSMTIIMLLGPGKISVDYFLQQKNKGH